MDSGAFMVEDFINAVSAQLDRVQDSLRLKAVNRPLTFALKDFALDLQVFAEMDGDGNVRFRSAGPNETGSSTLRLSFTTITRPMIEENTISLAATRSATLDELGLSPDERKRLEQIGVRNAFQLNRLGSATGGSTVSRYSGIPIDRLRMALQMGRPLVNRITPVGPQQQPANVPWTPPGEGRPFPPPTLQPSDGGRGVFRPEPPFARPAPPAGQPAPGSQPVPGAVVGRLGRLGIDGEAVRRGPAHQPGPLQPGLREGLRPFLTQGAATSQDWAAGPDNAYATGNAFEQPGNPANGYAAEEAGAASVAQSAERLDLQTGTTHLYLTGANLFGPEGPPAVRLNGQALAISQADDDQVVVAVPAGSQGGALEIELHDGQRLSYYVTMNAGPSPGPAEANDPWIR
jgi:hypothetical protein